MAIPQNRPDLCGLSWATKVVASGVDFTGRDPQDIFLKSCNWMAAPDALVAQALEQRDPAGLMALKPEVQYDGALCTMTLDGLTAFARKFGDQGWCVVPSPETAPQFAPVTLPQPDHASEAWPMGDQQEVDAGATGGDAVRITAAMDALFANPFECTNAVMVLHKGKVIAERYRPPFDRDTRFESWSMGKSIAATMVGVAARQGALSLDDRSLFDAWSGSGDPRRDISLANLLNMASGLRFTGSFGNGEDHSVKQQDGLFLDHIYVYASGCDSINFCLDKPLADPPGTAGRYRNCDPLLATAYVRNRVVGGDVQAFLSWPYEHLFHPIGATGMILETDPYGGFLISGHDYGRAIDWARLGQLHLQKGAWGSAQLFDESFADFVRTPAAKAWAHDPYYGGFFLTNATGLIPEMPRDTFWMSGGGRQRVMIVPSKELVFVRLGHMIGVAFGAEATMNRAFGEICDAIA
jgi:CubicO group peptidase (beta-lactamase class C family)